MQNLNIALIQTPLHWESAKENLEMFSGKLSEINQPVDLVVLPEMFTSGFTMEPARVAQTMDGEAIGWMKSKAASLGAVITGSLVIEDGGYFYNRLIWMQPDGSCQYYDKRHLFSFAGEDKFYTAGNERKIFQLHGWKILPIICFDLRFASWCRNQYTEDGGFDYDLMLVVANWPDVRSHAWRVLLMARAIENQAYVAGINRVGEDGNAVSYSGDSAVIDPRGENLSNLLPYSEMSEVVILPRCPLDSYRDSFRPWMEWD